jgi:dATP pyrophosphohydrolase
VRAEFQVLAIPFIRETNGSAKFVVFRRSDDGCWQFIAGGGEDSEAPLEATKREAKEEAGLESDRFYGLKTVSMIPIDVFREHRNKKNLYVIPEHCFAVEIEHGNITISKEHSECKILNYEEAFRLLKYDGNKTALWELNEKLKSGKLPSKIYSK